MKIVVNGETKSFEPGETVAELLTRLSYEGRAFAVAINLEFVPRGEYETKLVTENDRIEIVSPLQGG